MNIIRNGNTVTHRPDLSSMPQNEFIAANLGNPTLLVTENGVWLYEATGIIAEMAELTENRD